MSLYKISYSTEKMEKPIWVEDMGSYNHLPQPIQKTNIHEFLHSLIHPPNSYEFRQVYTDSVMFIRNAYIFWFWNCGFVVIPPSRWNLNKTEGEFNIKYHLDEAQFYRIGCVHKWEDNSDKQKGYINNQVCTGCGLTWDYDSSG